MKKLLVLMVLVLAALGCGSGERPADVPDRCELDWYSFTGEADCRVEGLSNVYEAEVDDVLVTVVALRDAEHLVFSTRYPDAVVTLVGSDGATCTSRNDTDAGTPPAGEVVIRDGLVVVDGYLTCPGGGWRYLRFVGPAPDRKTDREVTVSMPEVSE